MRVHYPVLVLYLFSWYDGRGCRSGSLSVFDRVNVCLPRLDTLSIQPHKTHMSGVWSSRRPTPSTPFPPQAQVLSLPLPHLRTAQYHHTHSPVYPLTSTPLPSGKSPPAVACYHQHHQSSRRPSSGRYATSALPSPYVYQHGAQCIGGSRRLDVH